MSSVEPAEGMNLQPVEQGAVDDTEAYEPVYDDGFSAVDAIAGLLAVGSIVLSGMAMGLGILLEQEARPVRLGTVAILAALLSAAMSDRFRRLSLWAVVIAAVAWTLGMTLMVLTENALY